MPVDHYLESLEQFDNKKRCTAGLLISKEQIVEGRNKKFLLLRAAASRRQVDNLSDKTNIKRCIVELVQLR